MQLLLTRNVAFGTQVVVIVHPDNTGRITIPSVEEGKVERRKVSADKVGLQPLNVRSPLFQCVPSRRGGPWRCVTTVRWDVLGSFAVWITCEAKLELGGLTSFGCVSAPRLRVVHQKNEVLLQLEESDARQEDIMCQMLWNETPGDLLTWVSHCNVHWFWCIYMSCVWNGFVFFSLPRSLEARKSWLLRQTWWHRASASR